MNVLKGFMILGAIFFMILSFVEQNNDKSFMKDVIGMLSCSIVVIIINFLS